MDEKSFKEIYSSVNEKPCVFEKTVLTRRQSCKYAHIVLLAEREGVQCNSVVHHGRCEAFMHLMELKSSFSLGTEVNQAIPHGKRLKMQMGALQGLQELLELDAALDIEQTLGRAQNHYGRLEAFPFSDIMRHVSHYRLRGRKDAS